MTAWDRIHALERELAELRVRVRRLDDINAAIERENRVLTEERDTARRVAMRLEDELANRAAQ